MLCILIHFLIANNATMRRYPLKDYQGNVSTIGELINHLPDSGYSDILTKPLGPTVFLKLRPLLMGSLSSDITFLDSYVLSPVVSIENTL